MYGVFRQRAPHRSRRASRRFVGGPAPGGSLLSGELDLQIDVGGSIDGHVYVMGSLTIEVEIGGDVDSTSEAVDALTSAVSELVAQARLVVAEKQSALTTAIDAAASRATINLAAADLTYSNQALREALRAQGLLPVRDEV